MDITHLTQSGACHFVWRDTILANSVDAVKRFGG